MKTVRTLALAVVVLGATALSASAATQVVGPVAIAQQPVDFSTTFSVAGFDTSLGTLTGVTLTLDTSILAEVDVFNSKGTSQSFANASALVPVTVSSLVNSSKVTVTTNATATQASGTAAPGFNAFPGLTATGSNSFDVASAYFSLFETGSNVDFEAIGGVGTYSGSAVPGVFFSGSAEAGGKFTVTYTYATPAVPEPATWAMLGLGFAALGVAGIRTRRGERLPV